LQQPVHQVQHLRAAAARGQHGIYRACAAALCILCATRTPRAIQHGAHAVAVAREQARQHGHKAGEDVALGVALRAKVDGGAQVQQKPGRHFAVFGEHAHMGRVQARRHVPVDVAHIVVGLVLAQIGQVQPAAAHQRAVVALQQAVEPPDDMPLQLPQQAVGLPGTWAGVARWRVQAACCSW
jgi:hypothetical protein